VSGILKSSLLLLFCSGAGSGPSAASLTAGQIEARIHAEGGRKVIKDLRADEAEFEEILSRIDSGESEWLDVALLLKPFSDGGTAEGVGYAVARALPKAPARVLSLVGHGFDLEEVCTSPFNEPAAGIAESYERKALAALATVRDRRLGTLASECAKRIKTPAAGG